MEDPSRVPPTTGRSRGPVGLGRAWVQLMTHPRRFFSTRVVPGDQAPGLVFAISVVAVEEAVRFLSVPGAAPVFAGRPALSFVLGLGLAVLLIAPAALHLIAAVATLGLALVADRRAGVSETVQVVGYATAPCVVAGLPFPELRVACASYGSFLLLVGLAEVHRLDAGRAVAVGLVPAVLTFGVGFRGLAAASELVGRIG